MKQMFELQAHGNLFVFSDTECLTPPIDRRSSRTGAFPFPMAQRKVYPIVAILEGSHPG